VVRVAALRDIGWYQGHLTEDLATGMRFHVGPWESVYVPEPLAVGEGPTTWAAYFTAVPLGVRVHEYLLHHPLAKG
jgi:cellulose synthase (UDP-forming)